MVNILTINLVLCVFVPLSFVSTLGCLSNKSAGYTYTNEVRRARKGPPIATLSTNRDFQCTIECNILDGCQSFNLIASGVGSKGFYCEYFNKSLFLYHDKEEIVELSSSTYYERVFRLKDCAAIHQGTSVDRGSGIYPLEISTNQITEALCDMDTGDGGWTLLQRRFDGSFDFYRDWESYKNGFGDLNGEFWLGLESARQLMKDTNTTLRFDLWRGTVYRYQEYYNAMIGSEDENYRLSYDGTAGNAGDSLSDRSKNEMFSTKDRDNDGSVNSHCAYYYTGGWWFGDCHNSNLNGLYLHDTDRGNCWISFTNDFLSLSKTEIKFKRNC